MSAAEINDTDALSRSLALVGNVNVLDSSGCTAMHRAVACNSLDALSALLAAGADCTIKDTNGCSAFMLAAARQDPSALKIILDGIETSTFCSLLRLQSIGLFVSLEASCVTVAEKFLGMFEATLTSGAVRVRPSALSLLVWRLPAAAVMGLDNDSLSHFAALCCFVGCEHSAKSIMSRRPSILSCVHSHGLSLLHIAALTSSHNVVQHALLVSTGLVNALSSKPPSSLKGEPTCPARITIAATHRVTSRAGGMDTPLHLACLGSVAEDERCIGGLLLAGGDADLCNSEGYRPRDLLLQTVAEEADYRAHLLALLDRPVAKPTRNDVVTTMPAVPNTPAAADNLKSVLESNVIASFIDCIGQSDTQRFKVLLGSHGLHHSRQDDGATLLHICAQHGFLQGVSLLLQSKCPMRLDLHGCTALHHAAAANHPLITSELLCAYPSSLAMCNDAGDTAFITAVRAQAPAVIAVLTAVPSGSTSRAAAVTKALAAPGAEGLPPLHLSVKIGALRCAELLLSAQPSHANFCTSTIPYPLHVVAASKSDFAEGAAKLLLQAGADVTARDSQGVSAADVATFAGNLSLARLLNNLALAVADLASLKVSAL